MSYEEQARQEMLDGLNDCVRISGVDLEKELEEIFGLSQDDLNTISLVKLSEVVEHFEKLFF